MENKEEQVKIKENSKYASMEPVVFEPLEVRVYDNNVERALRAFRAIVQKEKILSLYKEKQTYEKPSDKKRRKKNEYKQRWLESQGMLTGTHKKKRKAKKKRKQEESDLVENESNS